MNLKDEANYYLTRAFRIRKLNSKRENVKYSLFDKHKCIYIHIPKTAGISVSMSLLGERIGHLSALNYQALFGKEDFNNYFKFSFTRNPFTRLVSAYEFVKSGGYGPKDEEFVSIVRQYQSLEDFVMHFLTPETAKPIRYFIPQYHFLCDSNDRIMVDYVGRFEELQKDYDYVRSKIGTGDPLQKLNVTKSRRLPLHKYYTGDALIQKVISIYEKDFELLGYSKELAAIL